MRISTKPADESRIKAVYLRDQLVRAAPDENGAFFMLGVGCVRKTGRSVVCGYEINDEESPK